MTTGLRAEKRPLYAGTGGQLRAVGVQALRSHLGADPGSVIAAGGGHRLSPDGRQ